jgi:hypothetical protein
LQSWAKDAKTPTTYNASEEKVDVYDDVDYLQSQSNGINDIFENYDIWDLQTTGVDNLPWFGDWNLGVY